MVFALIFKLPDNFISKSIGTKFLQVGIVILGLTMSEIRLVSDVANELKNDLRMDVRRIEKVVNDVEQMVKEDSRETSSELRDTTRDMKEDMELLSGKLESAMTELEEKVEKRIKLALENPLSQMQ